MDQVQYPLSNATNLGVRNSLNPLEESLGNKVAKKTAPKRPKYRQHKTEDKNMFFHLVYEQQMSIRAACERIKVPASTGHNWYKKGKQSLEEEEDLHHRSPAKRASRSLKLNENHKRFLMDIVDEKLELTLDEIFDQLTAHFTGLDIKRFTLHKLLTEEFRISINRASFDSVEQNSPTKIEERYHWVKQWQGTHMNFENNCVFIDEAPFHINMRRSYTWPGKGKQIAVTPKNRARTTTLMGAISPHGTVSVKTKFPKIATVDPVQDLNNKGDTITGCYFNFIASILDTIDRQEEPKAHYVVIDNAPINKRNEIYSYVESRGYKCVYLPSHSPELSPVGLFWSIMKSKLKRTALLDEETLSDRISEACSKVTISDLQKVCKVSASHWDNCLKRNR